MNKIQETQHTQEVVGTQEEEKNNKIQEAIEKNFEVDNQEIARFVAEGNTSGILDNEAGYRISWNLNVEKFEY